MAKQPSIEHVKFVTAKGKRYPYFNTGLKNAQGQPIRVALPDLASPDFWPRYGALVAARTKRAAVAAYTIGELARDYERSKAFACRAENTKKLYRITIDKILEAFGDYPVNDLQRDDLDTFLESEEIGPGTHNIVLAVVGVLYRYGRRKGKTTLRPTEDVEKMEIGEHLAWPQPLVEAGLEAGHNRTRLAVHLLYFTGQRIGDVVRMRWSDIRDGHIHITQQKTGKYLAIPLIGELRAELDRTPKRALTIITNQAGHPMSDQVIRRELKAFAAKNGHPDLVPHGLRKNAVISLLEASCSIAETAAITGQTYRIVEKYARQVDQKRLGGAAIIKLENKRGTGKQAGKRA